jgi:hypothetical protein
MDSAEFTQVFDLALPEKLQLVEKATTPEQVPVLEWQKEELGKTKSSLLRRTNYRTLMRISKEKYSQSPAEYFNLSWVQFPAPWGEVLKSCAVDQRSTSKSASIPRPLAAGSFI